MKDHLTPAQKELQRVLASLADIETFIAWLEGKPRPLDKEAIEATRQRINGVKTQITSAAWTSQEATNKIKEIESRLLKLES